MLMTISSRTVGAWLVLGGPTSSVSLQRGKCLLSSVQITGLQRLSDGGKILAELRVRHSPAR
jgi:hypothetical protein